MPHAPRPPRAPAARRAGGARAVVLLAVVGALALGGAWAAWDQGHAGSRLARQRRGARADAAPRADSGAAPGPLGDTATTGRLARRDLIESSGLAASAAQPGVLFTLNDSGNEPVLYATDATGADRGAWRVAGAENRDWEALAVGPCPAGRCVYVGDVGDNAGRHATSVLYRVPEPRARAPRAGAAADDAAAPVGDTPPAERLVFRYADEPQDVEAIALAGDGTMRLITKRPRRAPDGGLRPALVYALPAAAWARPTSDAAPAVAALVDSLPPIRPGWGGPLQLVTDAAPSPDGRALAVRTYAELWIFATDPRTGRVRADAAPRGCDLLPLDERQGEALAWPAPGGPGPAGGLVLTSEGRHAPVHVVTCPAAPAAPGPAPRAPR